MMPEALETHVHRTFTSNQTKSRVLLIDDDPVFSEWVVKQLLKEEIHCYRVKSMREAMDEISNQSYHAVITDIFLESDSSKPLGLEIVDAAAREGIPTIIITQAASLEIAKEALNRGADKLLEKPFDQKTLCRMLHSLWEEPKNQSGRTEHLFEQYGLTKKEAEVARLVLKGLRNREIGEALNTKVSTVKTHIYQIYSKFGVSSRAEFINVVHPS